MTRPSSSSQKPQDPASAPTPEADAQAKVDHPAAHFEHPAEVLVDPTLSKDEKVRALEGLEQDARQIATASGEGMAGGQVTELQDVLVAKQSLDLPPFELATSVVLQGLKARLPGAEGSETQAVIARAIEALEAACRAIPAWDRITVTTRARIPGPAGPPAARRPLIRSAFVHGNSQGAEEQLLVDIALLERITARDQAALSDLYDRRSLLLFSLILRIVHDRGESEEVLQEVFLSVWTKAATYDHTLGSPVGWLVRLARNKAIDRLRANSVRTRAVDGLTGPPASENPEEAAVRSEEQGRVRSALDSLPAEQRVLLEQAYFRGLTHSELAKTFALPLGTVKTRVRSGMQALRQFLGIAVAQ